MGKGTINVWVNRFVSLRETTEMLTWPREPPSNTSKAKRWVEEKMMYRSFSVIRE
jgi:hypothetical protein